MISRPLTEEETREMVEAFENVPNCPRCGKLCEKGWVSSPSMGVLCRECYYRDEFPKITARANADALPLKILMVLGSIVIICYIVMIGITLWNWLT